MKHEELRAYREKLLALRARLRGDVRRMSDVELTTSRSNRRPIHMAEIAGNQFDQDIATQLLVAKDETLQRIERALEEIEDGTYGVCGECGRNIPKLRLNAVPYATECVSCG